VHDYSGVKFPPDLLENEGARTCKVCHDGNAPQSTNLFKPNRAACGACHDDVNFATGTNHNNLPQVSDNQCANCHIPQGEQEFDASIVGAHTNPRFSKDLPGTIFEIVSINDGAAGKKPTVLYRVKDKSGKDIPMNQVTRLAIVLAGPTSDYSTYVSEDPRATAVCGQDGICRYTFTATIPADAKGSFTVGMEGYRNWTLQPGTAKARTVRDAGVNVEKSFALDGGKVEARRTIVSLTACNACHFDLSLHGGNRNRIEQCVMCHNPVENDRGSRPAAQQPNESIDFRNMIHKIHRGEELANSYVVYGRGGPVNYNEVGFPGQLWNCNNCHTGNSQQLPLRENLLKVKTPRGYLPEVGPETAACTSCHDSRAAVSHALANTTVIGESCAACHGPNAEFSVNRVHAQ
jgi:OmcA/MtrC family decaheme c-type cytochrome